jgi:hypothetical protein
MSADHDALMRSARQHITTKIAMLTTMEALRRQLEKRLDDTHRRIGRSRDLLANSVALLQQAKSFRCQRLSARPMLHNQESN